MAAATSAELSDPPAKKRRRSRTYGLRTFMKPGCPTNFAGSFSDNISLFVNQCATNQPTPKPLSSPTWFTQLVDENTGVVVPLYTVEESVNHPFCDHCRCNGWSNHFVSKKRYHFIIPAYDDWDKHLGSDAFHVSTHLLHGLLHSDGFGHLLLINGREGGSKFISGYLLMNLWDRFCTSLRVRAVTLEDTSRKYSMDLPLLFGVAYGKPWFAQWGYRFYSGRCGVNEEVYNNAINKLSSLRVESLLHETRISNQDVVDLQRIVFNYSGPKCSTVSELFRHLLDLTHKSPQPALPPKPKKVVVAKKRYKEFDAVVAALPSSSRWSVDRFKFASQVIVDVLLKHNVMMTRREVRDAARPTIGDTGLLDTVLKCLANTIIGKYVVRRTVNCANNLLVYSIKELGSVDDEFVTKSEFGITSPPKDFLTSTLPSRWPIEKLKFTAQVIVDVLVKHKGMMNRKEIRQAARRSIGDTGLLDSVLKVLGNTIVGNHVVCRTINCETGLLEYYIKEPGSINTDSVPKSESESSISSPAKDFLTATSPSRWPVRKLKFTAQVIVDLLVKHDGMMTSKEIRDAARLTIGDICLVDFVLKSVDNTIIGSHVVCRTVNPATTLHVFSLKEVNSVGTTESVSESEAETSISSPMSDLLTVYNAVSAMFPDEVREILDAKQWRKEFDLVDEFDDRLRFSIQRKPTLYGAAETCATACRYSSGQPLRVKAGREINEGHLMHHGKVQDKGSL